MSDWTNTDSLTMQGFTARPVFGAMYAPVLVAQGPQLGLGAPAAAHTLHANEVFRATHAKIEAAKKAAMEEEGGARVAAQ